MECVCLKDGKTHCGCGCVVLDSTYWSSATVRRSTVVLIVVGIGLVAGCLIDTGPAEPEGVLRWPGSCLHDLNQASTAVIRAIPAVTSRLCAANKRDQVAWYTFIKLCPNAIFAIAAMRVPSIFAGIAEYSRSSRLLIGGEA